MSNLKEFPFPPQLLEATNANLPKWLETIAVKACASLQSLSLPTRKTENWKYSSRRLDLEACQPAATTLTLPEDAWLPKDHCAYFTDGVLDRSRSRLPSGGIELIAFSEAEADDIALIENNMQAYLGDNNYPFASLNAGKLSDGWLIKIGNKQIIEQPLALVFHNTGAKGSVHPRIIIEAGVLSQATIIEEYTGAEGATALTNAVTHVNLQSEARLTNIRLCMEPESVQHIGLTTVEGKRNSLFESHCVGFGGKLRRHDLVVKLQEEGANTIMNGITITQGEQHFDNHTVIEHVAAHCDSQETYRSMAADESQIVFNGRILIHRDAQKSNANMSNKNLLLSTGAEIDTKPELEIYADDVKCAHGATIGQLDKEALFYLVSRGIGKEEAASMLSMGFINELVQRIPVDELKSIVLERINRFLKETFAQSK